MEFGEHPEETARRETLEETGLAVDLGQLVKVDTRLFEFVDSHMHWIRFIYRADVSGGTMAYEADGSTDACGWFTREEAETLPLVELARLGVSLAFP
jgi:ADP-ribose pyrophosphatase YjhB (NUDIX family)